MGKLFKILIPIPVFGVFLLLVPATGMSSTFCAEPSGAGGCFTTIQAAVNAAGPGDTVEIEKGTYFEDVLIPAGKDGLRLEGKGAQKKIIIDADNPSTGSAIDVNSDNVTITNLTIQNGNSVPGILVGATATGTLINSVQISGPDGDCVGVFGDHTTVEHSTFTGCGQEGVDGDNVEYLVVQYNTMTNCDSDCIDIIGNNSLVDNNILSISDDGKCIEVHGEDNDITNNEVEICDDPGIEVTGNRFSVVKNKSSSARMGYSINCISCTNASVRNNESQGNAQDSGFQLNSDAPGLKVKGNIAESSVKIGFYTLEGSSEIVLEENISRENCSSAEYAGFKIKGTGHTLIRNTSVDNACDGYKISGDGHTLDDNIASGNLEDGFDVQPGAANAMLLNNEATDNLGVGIEVSGPDGDPAADLTTVDGNTASGNRTDFCDEGTNTTVGTNTFGTTGACAIGD